MHLNNPDNTLQAPYIPETMTQILSLMKANWGQAMAKYNEEVAETNKRYEDNLKKHYKKRGRIDKPNESEILKYRLWEEQKHLCPYTGNSIPLVSFICGDILYDVDHIVPVSKKGGNAIENKVLCLREFNHTKQGRYLKELPEYKAILKNLDKLGWQQNIETLRAKIKERLTDAVNTENLTKRTKAVIDIMVCHIKIQYWQKRLAAFTRK